MKKKVLVLASVFAATATFAQDLTSKKGEAYLPEAGDWAISIDASPFLNYAGQLLSNAGATAPTWNHLNGLNTIKGKLFVDAQTAYRATVRIGFNSEANKGLVAQPSTTAPSYPNLPTMVEDKEKFSSTFVGLGAGIELRRGKGRLQGFYGGEAFLWFSTNKASYEYANGLAPTGTPAVTVNDSYNFGGNIVGNDGFGNIGRVTEDKAGSVFGIGVRGFIGAEYFVLPKISIAGEFGWGIGFASQGTGSRSVESINGTTVGTVTTETAGGSRFLIDTDRNAFGTGATQFVPSGTLSLNLHF